MSNTTPPMLRVQGLQKRFGAVRALRGVDLEVSQGEIVSLVGPNGAGKSTLIRIVSGAASPDAGEVLVDGEKLRGGVRGARLAGIGVVHQELNVVGHATAAENIFLWGLPSKAGFVRQGDVATAAQQVLDELGVELDGTRPAHSLTPVERRLVMVAAAMSQDARLLILDEPTAALPQEEAALVLDVALRLRTLGKSVIFVSHRLDEVHRISDRTVVLRDGASVDELKGEEIKVDRLVELMGGAQLARQDSRDRRASADGDHQVHIRVRGLSGARIRSLDLDVRAGEVLGVAGLVGAGRSELLRLLAGIQRPTAGTIDFDGRAVRDLSEVRGKIGYVGEDRAASLFAGFNVAGNVTLPSLHRFVRGAMVRRKLEAAGANDVVRRMHLKGTVSDSISGLSGGNKQKVLLGRWLMADSKVLLLDEPTAGIDVAARTEIHRLLRELTDAGAAVVVAIADPGELLALCDRVIVLAEGRQTLACSRPFDESDIVAASFQHAAA